MSGKQKGKLFKLCEASHDLPGIEPRVSQALFDDPAWVYWVYFHKTEMDKVKIVTFKGIAVETLRTRWVYYLRSNRFLV